MTMTEGRRMVVTGVMPPLLGEAIIRETWPGVMDMPLLGGLAEKLQRTYILAPLAWLLLAPCYFGKILPFLAKRYTLTNRRVMVRRGLKPVASQEVALGDIKDVRLDDGSYNAFYRSGNLDVIVTDDKVAQTEKVALTLRAVSDPETFRRAILNARVAWAPRLKAAPVAAEKPA